MEKQKFTFKKNNQDYSFEYNEGNAIACLEVMKKNGIFDTVIAVFQPKGFSTFVEAGLKNQQIRDIIFDNIIDQNEGNLTKEVLNTLNATDLTEIIVALVNLILGTEEKDNPSFPSNSIKSK